VDLSHEETLVEQAKSDMNAFGVLYDAYYGKIFSYALRRVADVPLAQDITSEVFLKALRGIGRFKWQGLHFSAWLYRIAGNEIADSYRTSNRERVLSAELTYSLGDTGEGAEEEVARLEEELREEHALLKMQQALSNLPSVYQEVISLRYFEKKPLKEIGEILGKKEETVKTLLYRGIARLRKQMGHGSPVEVADGQG
jgi:RNA polymerase sigma-70 factor (ECF subfamily)